MSRNFNLRLIVLIFCCIDLQSKNQKVFCDAYKGWGVVATKIFRKGDFIARYNGRILCEEEGLRKETLDGGTSFRFYVEKDKLW